MSSVGRKVPSAYDNLTNQFHLINVIHCHKVTQWS